VNPSLCVNGVGGIAASNQELFSQDANGLVFDARGNGDGVTCPTVTGDHAGRPTDYTPVVCRMTAFGEYETYGTASTMKQRDYKDATDLVVNPAVAFEPRFVRTRGGLPSRELNPCLRADVKAGDGAPCVATGSTVRRLTPIECERLMGFPPDWTRIPWRGKPAEDCPDGPRYKACGNSMGVNVMRWFGTRIQEVEANQ